MDRCKICPPLHSGRPESSVDNTISHLNPEFNFEQYGIGAKNSNAITSQSLDQMNIQAAEDGFVGVQSVNKWIEEAKTEVEQLLLQTNEESSNAISPFPVEVFPLAVQQIIQATNENLSFPIDFISASLLYAASVAIGNTYRVEVKRSWKESAVIYLALVAKAGTNKSHPLSFALQPIFDRDNSTYLEYLRLKKEYDKTVSLSKKERIQQGLDEPQKPVLRKLLLSDYTPEALAEVHKFNQRGIGIYIDELAGWFKNFNRYNKGSEMEFWLSAWSGKPVYIDRKTNEPASIPLPFISVAGTIQNGILNELAKDSRTQNGFIDRILFVIPDNVQKEYWNDKDINQKIIHDWQSTLSNLLNLPLNLNDEFCPEPEVLHFSPDAKQILFDWQKRNADECNAAENDAIRGIYSKLEMYAIRLSLILELMSWACSDSNKQAITINSMKGALKLVEYFKNSAVKVYSIISNTNPTENLTADKRTLYNSLPNTFTTDQGLQIAETLQIPERTFKRFIMQKDLFIQLRHGEYEKLF
jgi:hypothetical protein